MPRRLITSEIWANEKFGSLDLVGRLVFIGLITHADDDGRLKGSPNYLRIKIFPYDINISPPMINEALEQCQKQQMIIRYNVNGGEYISLCGWSEHQQIRGDRYKESPLPPPPDDHPATNGIPTGNQTDANGIPNDNQTTTTGKRNISKDNISKDNISSSVVLEKQSPIQELKTTIDHIIQKSPYGDGIKQVFAGLLKKRGYKTPKNQAEAKSIRNMLKEGYTPDQILDTWDKMKGDSFWQGKELFMMSVEKQIGAILKSKPTKSEGNYSHMVRQ